MLKLPWRFVNFYKSSTLMAKKQPDKVLWVIGRYITQNRRCILKILHLILNFHSSHMPQMPQVRLLSLEPHALNATSVSKRLIARNAFLKCLFAFCLCFVGVLQIRSECNKPSIKFSPNQNENPIIGKNDFLEVFDFCECVCSLMLEMNWLCFPIRKGLKLL